MKVLDNPFKPTKYNVLEFYRETPDTFTLTIDMGVKHLPGQFVQVSIPGIGEAPISVCSDSREHLKLSIREVGNVTEALSNLREGDTILVRGPYGNGYPMKELRGNNLVFIGGGCGVAPLKGIIDYVENHRDDYKQVQLFLGYRSPDDILYERELEEWRNKYHLLVTVDEAKTEGEGCYTGKTGFVTQALTESDVPIDNTVVFICGPPIMMEKVIEILHNKGFRDEQIFISAERLMFCAIGQCCHCMIREKYTCVDGPVFRYDEVRDYTND